MRIVQVQPLALFNFALTNSVLNFVGNLWCSQLYCLCFFPVFEHSACLYNGVEGSVRSKVSASWSSTADPSCTWIHAALHVDTHDYWSRFLDFVLHSTLLYSTQLFGVDILRLPYSQVFKSWRKRSTMGGIEASQGLGILPRLLSNCTPKDRKSTSISQLPPWLSSTWHYGMWCFRQLCIWGDGVQQVVSWYSTSSFDAETQLPISAHSSIPTVDG